MKQKSLHARQSDAQRARHHGLEFMHNFRTMRTNWKRADPVHHAVYFHFQTKLVETSRVMFPDDVEFEGNRALVFSLSDGVPQDALRTCIAAAVTYRLQKNSPVPDASRVE